MKPMARPARFQGRGRLLADALRAIFVLRRGRWTMFELADELGIAWRSTYRLVDAIRKAGVEIEVSRERDGRQVDAYYRITAVEMWRILKL